METFYVNLAQITDGHSGSLEDQFSLADAVISLNTEVPADYIVKGRTFVAGAVSLDIADSTWSALPGDFWAIKCTGWLTIDFTMGTGLGSVSGGYLRGSELLIGGNSNGNIFNCIMIHDSTAHSFQFEFAQFNSLKGCIISGVQDLAFVPSVQDCLIKWAPGKTIQLENSNFIRCAMSTPFAVDSPGIGQDPWTKTLCQDDWEMPILPDYDAPRSAFAAALLSVGVEIPPQPGTSPYTGYEAGLWGSTRNGIGACDFYILPVQDNPIQGGSRMETSKVSPNVTNLAMPRGALSFAPVNDAGETAGEVDLGNVTTFDLTNAIAYKEHMTSHDSVVVMDAKKPSEQKWTCKFTPDEFSAENVALFFLGDPNKQNMNHKTGDLDVLAQRGEAREDQDLTIYLDRWINLGAMYVKPSSIILKGFGGAGDIEIVETVSGTYPNYRLDYETGLIMIRSDNQLNIDDGDEGTVDYKYGTCTLRRFPSRIRPMVGFLRYRGLGEQGPRHMVECWKVQITPDAALSLIKPSDYANLGFSGDVFIDDDTNAHKSTDPFFRVTELGVATSYPS